MNIDPDFITTMLSRTAGYGDAGGPQMLKDLRFPPIQVAPQSVEELFIKPHMYETNNQWNLGGFYNYDVRNKTYTNSKDPEALDIRQHEAEHALSDMAPPPIGKERPISRGERFVENSFAGARKDGMNWSMRNEYFTRPAEFLGKVASNLDKIKAKYPEFQDSLYFDKDWLMKNVRNPNALNEVLANLAVLEKKHKIDLLKDPAFKDIWTSPGAYHAYRSLVGLRNTITDPKDIPAQSVDTGKQWYGSAIQEMNKR